MVRQREAQAVAAATGFGALAAGLRAETRDAGVLVVSAIVLAGSLPAVAAAVAAADPRLRLVRRDGAAALYRVAYFHAGRAPCGALRRCVPPGWPLVRRRFQDQW